ncbi:dihydroxyacetone kinase subunit DhaK [Kushneria aurantia]|uniref:Dihydroxyacetone kinase subunit DhaK n=1 Tax=Kushneria aurantia TaxID=504092 RepID=A0ABV6FZJ9_9GAMM|nr:dihydroxyacetone kinase subunit DhaK [Kushneria aurantia]
MDRFYNQPRQLVDQMLEGLALFNPVTLCNDPSARIVMRRDWQPRREGCQQVALISGGGSGHEPAHGGFVGEGMLTAAVAGDLFASPGVEAVLAAIRACCGEAGCLLIIKNYTGDRLNFGLAAERAREEGYRIETVIVADDVALPDAEQPRGLAGTLLVHKIAGFHAGRGDSLETVLAAARDTATALRSLGMALSSATLPGNAREKRRSPELGLGIHNEPGARHIDPHDAHEAVQQLLATLDSGDDGPFVLLLNNLGGCSPQEMQLLARECLQQWGIERVALLIGPAAMMSSLDMHGFSLTALPLSDARREALEAQTTAVGWAAPRPVAQATTFTPRFSEAEASGGGRRDAERAALIKRLAQVLRDSEEALDRLDAKVGDGDAGATFAAGAGAVLTALDEDRLSTGEDARLASELGQLFAASMGGSSGVLVSILMSAACSALEAQRGWPAALAEGVARMQHYGGAERGDRTLLDALIPAVEALEADASLQDAARAAREGARATAAMTRAGAGRASQVPGDALEGVTDPGAEAMARLFEALAAR